MPASSDRQRTDRSHVVIVGGGISGLATAHWLRTLRPEARVTVLERSDHPGGTARTDQRLGFTVDRGPSGFMGSAAELQALVASLGMADQRVPASDRARSRYLFAGGALQAAPTDPWSFLTSGLLSPLEKMRVLGEPFAARPPAGVDETVHAFAARRLGAGFADTLVAAMVRGVTAGDARKTSLAALFPKMRQMEEEHGGLVRAWLAKRRAAGGRTADASGPAGPGGRLTTFRHGGMQHLIDAMADQPGIDVITGVEVVAVSDGEGSDPFSVLLGSGETVSADQVVLATPSFVSSQLLAELVPAACDPLDAIPYAGARVVALGYDAGDVPHPLDGFGFLVPPGESVRMLGCQWSSSLFPSQAPAGKVLLRVIGGGVDDSDFVARSDADALAVARRDLHTTLGIEAEPEFVHQIRWDRAIPQYTVGHGHRVETVMREVARKPGLHLVGNAYYGVGLEACVAHAHRVAKAVAADGASA